jgi:hypothetical protein
MPKLATPELVAVAYGKAVLSLAGVPTVPVVTTLPEVSTWQATGAVQVESIVGTGATQGRSSRDNNLRDVVVSYGGWGARPNSDKPPWGQANGLLEFIRESAFWDWADAALPLDLEPAGVYNSVLVQGAIPVTEPRRIPDQDAGRAHYSMDFRLIWTPR